MPIARPSKATTNIHQLIVIEGIDGTGKTTVARMLAKAIGATYFMTPPAPFKSARHYVDKQGSLQTRFLFYLCSVAYASDVIRSELSKHDVVCDRYIATTLAYHRAMGMCLKWDVKELNLVEPSSVFLLSVSNEHERLRRIKRRGKISAGDRLLEDAKLRQKMMTEFKRFKWVQIDTAKRTPEQVVRVIKSQLNR